MGDQLILERYYWVDCQVRRERFPNARKLADQFEISSKTAQRSIEFMRDRLGAPLEYDPGHKGYRYSDDTFTLPSFHIAQEELVSILLARNLLSKSAGGIISERIKSFGRKLITTMGGIGFSEKKLNSAFSAVWHGHSPAPAITFRVVTDALLNERYLICRYNSPSTGTKTERKIAPHHLQHYMGSWVLIGWCTLRQDWRKFFLSRMIDPDLTDEVFTPYPNEKWEPLLQKTFGIFQGEKSNQVTLHFNAFRSPWISEQIWHPDQKIDLLQDGSLRLTIPVADFREIKMRVLQFGADVEVVEPEELREEINNEIKKMEQIYTNE